MLPRIATNTNLISFCRDGRRTMLDIVPLLAGKGFRELDLNFCEMMNPVSELKKKETAQAYISKLESYKKLYSVTYHQCHLPYTADYLNLPEDKKAEQDNDIFLALSYAEKLGVPIAVIHPIRGNLDANLIYFERLISNVPDGMKLAIENMEREDELYSADQLLYLVERLGPKAGICLDTGHAHIMKQDIPEFISKTKDKLIATHIADNNGKDDQHLLPGFGTIEWEKVIPAFKRYYVGYLNYEAMFHGRNLPKSLTDIHITQSLEIGDWLLSL